MGSNMRLLSIAAVVVVAGCSTKEAPPAADSATVSATPASNAANVVNFTTSEYKYEGPDQIPSGLTTFSITDKGQEHHHASLIKLDSGKTVEDLMAGIKSMKPGSRPPGWMIPVGGPNASVPGGTSSLTMVLEPGNYGIVCFIPDAKGVPHMMNGMYKGLTVTENPNAVTTLPTPDITVTLKDYEFDLSSPLTAGKHIINVVTAPGQPHELVLFKLAPGKTAADVRKFAEGGMQGQPPAMPVGGVTAMAAGKDVVYEVNLEPGEYALVCFLEDAKDGKPHFVHGMIKQVSVS